MKEHTYRVKYPRRVVLRKVILATVRSLLSLLTEVNITGQDRLPKKGPLILAGNHVAALEPVLMAAYTPGLVEFIGNGDIPFDPNYAVFAHVYGLIPVNRGNLDRKGLKMAVDVLNQEGILGIFPEGGTWDPAHMQAQIGVAWLSYQSQAPILPIGFGGMNGGLEKAIKLQHPTLTMHVGELIPPVTLENNNLSIKTSLASSANLVLKRINALIPPDDSQLLTPRSDEKYYLRIEILDRKRVIEVPDDLRVRQGSAYAHFLFNPTMMDVLVRNLHLPIKPIRSVNQQKKLKPLLKAWKSIFDYISTNPGYFTYRFGVEEGLAVKKALLELIKLTEWVQKSGYVLTIQPIRRYRNDISGEQVTERGGCFPKSM